MSLRGLSRKLAKRQRQYWSQAFYAYNASWRRLESKEGSSVTFYAYLGAQRLAEVPQTGYATDHIYANGMIIATITNVATSYCYRMP